MLTIARFFEDCHPDQVLLGRNATTIQSEE